MATRSSIRHIEVPKKASGMLVLVVGILASVALPSCQLIPGERPTPTPTPVATPVEQLYRYLESEKELNQARLSEMEGQWFRFRGRIARIAEGQIRFNIEPPEPLADDKYVECNFASNEQVTSVNVGEEVAIRGRLARALRGRLFGLGELKAVVFEDCRVSEVN